MKNRLLQLAFTLSLTLLVTVTLARADQPTPLPKHLDRALELVAEILDAQHLGAFAEPSGPLLNRYGGSWNSASDPSFIRFAGPNSTLPGNNTTCAPLVTHLLKFTYGWDWSLLPIFDPLLNTWVATASPKAYRYVSAIKLHTGFVQQLTRLADVLPGDIAAYWDVGTDDGHAMIVASVDLASAKPYPSSTTGADPALAGTTFYEMTVLDSSASGHTNDTRLVTINGVTALTGGAGAGIMGVLINAAGEIVAHTWSLPTSNYTTVKNGATIINPNWLSGLTSRLKFQTSRELVFGRLPALTPLPGVP